MFTRAGATIILALIGFSGLHGADIEGTIIIKRKLSKRTITAPASSYQRGAAVQLGSDSGEDPIAFERMRVVVYLEGQLPSTPVTQVMEQKNRRFVPDLLVVPTGSAVPFPNLDATFHNVFSLSKPKSFDLGNYVKEQTRTQRFPNPGPVFVNCHLHPNMGAVVFVTPNQWSTRVDASGHFRLPEVPPGSYTIVAWHKAVGYFRQKISVQHKSVANVEFFIPFDANLTASTQR